MKAHMIAGRLFALVLLLGVGVMLASCRLPVSEDLRHEGGEVSNYNFSLDYEVWLPDGYDEDTDRTYPLLVWFHGGGENELGWGRKGRIGELVRQRVARGELQPCIVVSPSAGTFLPVFRTYERLLLESVLPDVRRNYRVNSTTLAFGHSMGGLSALMVSLRHPRLFKAVVVASPFVFDTTPWDSPAQKQSFDESYPSRFVRQYRYQIGMNFDTREQADQWSPYSLLRNRKTERPPELLLTVGDQDPLGLFAHTEHLHQVMLDQDVPHDWYVQKGVGHGTVEDPHLMDWLNERAGD